MGLKADLHTHTIYSDGTLTPAELFDKAVERGIDALSITDHDTIDGCIEGAGIISDYDLEFVPGIELSCYENGKEYHLLGYEIDLDNKLFKKHLEFLRNARYKRAEKMHNRLKELGLVFPFEHILEKAGKAPVARPHIASALVDMGFVANFREGFDIYLNDRGPAYEPKWVFPVENGIKLINQIGGIAVLAHPGKYVAQEALFRFINAGLDGIEVIHPSHDEKKQRHYSSIASQYLILETGGSDYHGLKDHEEELFGKITVPYSFVESIRSYLA